MTLTEKIRTYIWIVSQLSQEGYLTLQEINQRWHLHTQGKQLSFERNTFRRYLDGIHQLFGITINYKVSSGYYIENPGMLHARHTQSVLLANLHEAELLAQYRALGSAIQVEDIPVGHEFLPLIAQSIQNHQVLQVQYQKFIDEQPATLQLSPYCLKAVNRRWYLVAEKNNEGILKCFALDRVQNLSQLTETFKPNRTFDVEHHFDHSIGIFVNDQPVEHLVLKATPIVSKYLRTLPLHSTQKEVESGVFHYHLLLTPDVENHLLSYGAQVEVLQPQHLRDSLLERVKQMLQLYTPE